MVNPLITKASSIGRGYAMGTGVIVPAIALLWEAPVKRLPWLGLLRFVTLMG